MTSLQQAGRPSSPRSWPVPAALVALSAIPLMAGTARLAQLAGRVLAVAGLMVAVSALWMTLLYAQKPGTGDLLYVLRLGFGSAMGASLVLGFTAIRRRDIPAHRAWMIRAYAIGGALFGTGELCDDLAKGAGWSSTSPSPNGSSAALIPPPHSREPRHDHQQRPDLRVPGPGPP